MADYSTVTLTVLHSDLNTVMEHLATLTQISVDNVEVELPDYEGPPYLVDITIYGVMFQCIEGLSLKAKGVPYKQLTEDIPDAYQENFYFYTSEGQQEMFYFSNHNEHIPLNELEGLSDTEKLEVISQAIKKATRPSWLDQKEYGKRYLIMQAITN